MEVPQHWAEAQRFNNATLGHDRPTASKSEHFVVEFLLSAAVFAVVNLVFQRLHMQGFRQPPRPSAWKFLFQIYVLRRNPTVVLHNLVKQHGPVIRVRLWSQDLLVLSSVAAVEEFYKLHDAEFGARPTSMNRATLTNSIRFTPQSVPVYTFAIEEQPGWNLSFRCPSDQEMVCWALKG